MAKIKFIVQTTKLMSVSTFVCTSFLIHCFSLFHMCVYAENNSSDIYYFYVITKISNSNPWCVLVWNIIRIVEAREKNLSGCWNIATKFCYQLTQNGTVWFNLKKFIFFLKNPVKKSKIIFTVFSLQRTQ